MKKATTRRPRAAPRKSRIGTARRVTRKTGRKTTRGATPSPARGIEAQELESLRSEIERLGTVGPPRWNADPEDVRRSVAKLVLTLVEFIRQLLERQAIRRMEAGTLSADETEAVGLALMRLEETVRDLAGRFGLDPNDLNLDLGPAGRLI